MREEWYQTNETTMKGRGWCNLMTCYSKPTCLGGGGSSEGEWPDVTIGNKEVTYYITVPIIEGIKAGQQPRNSCHTLIGFQGKQCLEVNQFPCEDFSMGKNFAPFLLGQRYYLHLVDKGQKHWEMPHNAQDSLLKQRIMWPQMSIVLMLRKPSLEK